MSPRNNRREHDRRFEPRRESAGRILWHSDAGPEDNVGWLSDRSLSSLTFVTATQRAPRRGQTIHVVDSAHASRRFRVTRISDYDETCSLIACRATRPFNTGVPSKPD
jgi:hypothetical protein